jgi:predicted O-methyltransferase YrrM
MSHRIRRYLRQKLIRVVEEGTVDQAKEFQALRKDVADLRSALTEAIRQVEFRSRRDIFAADERHAVATSAEFAREVMPTVPRLRSREVTLEHALSIAPDGGLALEFGVWEGYTLRIVAAARDGKEVYGFDSFEGLPEDWRTGVPAGTFRVDEIPEIEGAELVVGWFDKSLPEFLDKHDGPVSFLHIDCDLYASTKTVLDHVGGRLRPGSVVLFDEYFNHAGWENGEHRAWREFADATGTRFEYVGYTIDHEQVIVVVTD